MWAEEIGAYNVRASACGQVGTVYAYGGALELYPELSPPWRTYFPPSNRLAATIYAGMAGVESVWAVVDGRFDAGLGAPDLTLLTSEELGEWARYTAALY